MGRDPQLLAWRLEILARKDFPGPSQQSRDASWVTAVSGIQLVFYLTSPKESSAYSPNPALESIWAQNPLIPLGRFPKSLRLWFAQQQNDAIVTAFSPNPHPRTVPPEY